MADKKSKLENAVLQLGRVQEHLKSLIEDLETDWLTIQDYRGFVPQTIEERNRLSDALMKADEWALLVSRYAKWTFWECHAAEMQLKIHNLFAEHGTLDEPIGVKKIIASDLNQQLRIFQASIYADKGSPHNILVVVTSRDGKGRYALEDKETKKRSGSYKTILNLFPLKYADDAPKESWANPLPGLEDVLREDDENQSEK